MNPIIEEKVVFCVGTRSKNLREKGAITIQQVFGNALACFLNAFTL